MARRNEINILFTSAGRRVELLRAFRRAYTALGLGGNLVATDIDPLAPALQVVDHTYIVPRVDHPDYIPALTTICRREAIDLVFPLIDPDIPLLARHRQQLEETGARVVVVSAEAAAITADKAHTTQFFRELELDVARSWLPTELYPEQASYPLFIKPRRGSAGKHTYRVDNARQLRFFTEYVPDPIVEEYLPGPEITTDVVCGLDGQLLGLVSRQRIEVRAGEVAKGVTVYDKAIIDGCARIACALPGLGPITVQCMMRNGKPYFTEINARFGGGVPLGVAAGVDAPRWLLAQAAGIALQLPELGDYETGLHLTRFDNSYFLNEDDIATTEAWRPQSTTL